MWTVRTKAFLCGGGVLVISALSSQPRTGSTTSLFSRFQFLLIMVGNKNVFIAFRTIFSNISPEMPCSAFREQAPGSSSDGFFQEQLMAFDTWLQSAGEVSANTIGRGIRQSDPPSRLPPKQLPVILQALLSPVGFASMEGFSVFCTWIV